ncbi:MAG TPA: hypothetical protein VHZ50_12595, partial [Puia sp.]|nr:hypothetical protein [Puia sp.]
MKTQENPRKSVEKLTITHSNTLLHESTLHCLGHISLAQKDRTMKPFEIVFYNQKYTHSVKKLYML